MYTKKTFPPTEQATQIYVSPLEVQTGLRETCPTMANDQIWKLHRILLRIWKTPAFCSRLPQIHSFGKLHSAFVFEHPACCDKSLTPLNPGWAWFSDFLVCWNVIDYVPFFVFMSNFVFAFSKIVLSEQIGVSEVWLILTRTFLPCLQRASFCADSTSTEY